jgi:hypothetical protein
MLGGIAGLAAGAKGGGLSGTPSGWRVGRHGLGGSVSFLKKRNQKLFIL